MKRLFSLLVVFSVSCLSVFASIQLPATLDKSNVSSVSSDMTYYNTDYFDFGPTDASNTSRWAEWNVWLRYPGSYIISEVSYCANGHTWSLELLDGSTVVASYTTTDDHWGAGEQNYTQTVKWDLSSVTAGEYTLRVKNATEWGQPKLKSLTLEYDGEIPTDPDPVPDPDPSGTSVTYTIDNSIFANPERGFYYHYEKVLTASSPYAVKGNTSEIDSHASDYGSLILIVYYLDNFKTTATLPTAIINAFDEDMATLRSKGMKCIVRYAYNSNSSQSDAAWSIVQQHINQLKSKWQSNADVIYCFQIGWVGSWGEWYYSTNFGNHATEINTNRRNVVDAMLSAVPSDRYILIRTPLFKTSYLGSTTPLTASEAYQNTPKARIGHHNDAFLYGGTGGQDQGTYEDTATQKPYIARETLYVPIGGETNETNATNAKTKASYNNTIKETSRLHYTFINQGYAEAMTNQWRSNGTYDSLRIHLGYRFQLLNGTYTSQAAPGGTMSVYMKIRNVGFAPLYNERPAYIVLKNSSHTYTLPLDTDPRTWRPNGVTTTVSEELSLPSDIATGTYSLYLYMPDAYSSLASNSKYAVRFANTNMWNSTTGMNDLKASIVITNTPSTPSLSVEPTSVAFGNVSVASTATRTITVTGTNLTGSVTLSSSNAALSLSSATLTQAQATSGATITLSLTPTTAGSGSATVTIASSGATNKTVNVTWTGTAISGAVDLPGTLNKANMSAVSSDMTYYNTDYFDFGPTDASNLDRWAEWIVNLTYSGEYTVSEIGYSTTGQNFSLQLLSGSTVVSEYATTRTWPGGDFTTTESAKWDLSDVSTGVYTLRVKNATEWGQPKLKSLTLDCDALATSYTITWNATANGGTCSTSTTEIAIGDPLGTLPTATKSGYVCIGWFTSASGGSPVKSTTIPTGNVTYYAQFLPIPQLTGTAVDLPNTLNKANMGEASSDMTYFDETTQDHFDIGPTDATNLYRWAAWRVNLNYPASYTVTEETNCSNGHQYIMQLFSGNNLVAEYTTSQESAATTGDQVFAQTAPWDLSALSAGTYVLVIRNVYAYSQPKLKRITLDTDLPTYTITYNKGQYGSGSIAAGTKTYGVDFTLSSSTFTRTGYTQTGWSTTDGGAKAYNLGATYTSNADLNLYPFWSANTNTAYTVKHHQQNLVGDGYTLAETEPKTGTTAAQTAAVAKTYTGFTAKAFSQKTIAADGSTVVDIYYDRQTFEIEFVVDEEAIQTDNLRYGAMPVAPADPTKPADEQYTYTFDHWTPEIAVVTGNATYTALFSATLNKYLVEFYNWNSVLLQSSEWEYGTTPVYSGPQPTREDDHQFTYTFAGWQPQIEPVTGEAFYFANFSGHLRTFSANDVVTSNDPDMGSVAISPQEEEYEYGEQITITATPSAEGYVFSGWQNEESDIISTDSVITISVSDSTLTAIFVPNPHMKYIVSHWLEQLEGGFSLDSSDELYGTTGTWTSATAKTLTGFTAQDFEQKQIAAEGLTEINIYYNRIQYEIRFMIDDQVVQTSNWRYGDTPTYNNGTPTKQGNAQYSYTFVGWDPQIVPVSGETTYRAVFSSEVNRYTVTFHANGHATDPEPASVEYGHIVNCTPLYADDGWIFDGWFREAGCQTEWDCQTDVVTADIDLYAKWIPSENMFYWVNYWQQNIYDDDYTLVEFEQIKGTTGQMTQAEAKTYTGFTMLPFSQVPIAPNTEVNIYYDRLRYEVHFVVEGVVVQSDSLRYYATAEYRGDTPTKPDTDTHYYTFWCWDKATNIAITEDITFTALFNEWPKDPTGLSETDNQPVARKVMMGNHVYIIIGNQMYDILGNKQ